MPGEAARPFLKWAGGKSSLLPEICARLPAKIKTYYEPFIGGGAVFFDLARQRRFEHAVLGDTNEELICAYESVRDHVEELIERLNLHAERHREDPRKHYYLVRSMQPFAIALDLVARAARLIYLNKTCFNGLYRVNQKGEFNVPIGAYANPTICDSENLRACSRVLRNVELLVGGFENTVAFATSGDAVYFDPPYIPASLTSSFVGYARDGFSQKDQERLESHAFHLSRGVGVLLSNSDTETTREIYRHWKMECIAVRRSINSRGHKRGPVGELLITPSENDPRRSA